MTRPRRHVLVAHDSAGVRVVIERLLIEAGLRVTVVADGHGALARLGDRPPADVVVLDVAVSGRLAFEVLDQIRSQGLPSRTLLVASVYNRTGYKRRPTSLYGADDYIEQHHIPDMLVAKVTSLLGGLGTPATVKAADADAIREAGEGRLHMRYRSVDEGRDKARRLARLIVADIALYNGDAIAAPSREEFDARLRLDVEEGRLLYELRVPPEIRKQGDFIDEALTEWYAQRVAP